MIRFALIAAFLAATCSPAAHCLMTAQSSEVAGSCHEDATPKPAKAPMSDCVVMVCCQTVLLPATVSEPAPESGVPVIAAVAILILLPSAPPTEFAPAAPPGPPGVLLVATRLGRAPPVA